MRQTFLKSFADTKSRFEKQRGHEPRLICRVGDMMNCAVLKLQKAAWTNDDLSKIGNQTGIFFSIWITDSGAAKGRADYNIHAMSVRKLKSCRLTSNDFCNRFRARFAKLRKGWPNVSVDFGCCTLMQGSYPIRQKSLASDALGLMNRFEKEIAPVIDDLMKPRIKLVKPRRPAAA